MGTTQREATEFETLAEGLEAAFGEGIEEWRPGRFERLALDVFARQFEANPTYRAFCRARGSTPETVARWCDVPAVPTTAFKHLDLVSGGPPPEATFVTSGTTGGPRLRGRHLVPRLSLYRASLVEPFRSHVTGGREGLVFVSLVPSREAAPESSLSFMIDEAAARLASETHHLVGADGALDLPRYGEIAGTAREAGTPVALLGTALSHLHLVERLEGAGVPELPVGSVVMETGGFKGSGREVSRARLYAGIAGLTGVAPERVVNEYGMTELLSQLYEPVLSEGAGAAGTHVPPPWLAVRALHPTTLAPVPEGELGILAFFDLANLGSVAHVLTQDMGSLEEGRVRLRGRAEGAEPRGCSRAMDELLTAAGTIR